MSTNKTERFELVFSPSEKAILRKLAYLSNKSIAEVIRDLVVETAESMIPVLEQEAPIESAQEAAVTTVSDFIASTEIGKDEATQLELEAVAKTFGGSNDRET